MRSSAPLPYAYSWSKIRRMHTTQVTTRQTAARLGIHPRTVARLVERGELRPAARLDLGHYGAFVFDNAEVERVAALRAKNVETEK